MPQRRQRKIMIEARRRQRKITIEALKKAEEDYDRGPKEGRGRL